MSSIVRIPTPLGKLTAGAREISVNSETVGACIAQLEARFPGLGERLCDERGELRRFINVYVNGEDVRFLAGLATPLRPGDEVYIVPAMAGG